MGAYNGIPALTEVKWNGKNPDTKMSIAERVDLAPDEYISSIITQGDTQHGQIRAIQFTFSSGMYYRHHSFIIFIVRITQLFVAHQ